MKKTDDETLIQAIRLLARDIISEDGVARSVIMEAADRIEERSIQMTDELRKRIIEKLDADKCLDTLDDGYLRFWPSPNRGCFSADALRVIADEIDSRNEEYDRFMKKMRTK